MDLAHLSATIFDYDQRIFIADGYETEETCGHVFRFKTEVNELDILFRILLKVEK